MARAFSILPPVCRSLNGLLWALLILVCPLAKAFDTVVLDAGHGDFDRGAAIGYVYEKHLALDTARRVEDLLKKAGLKVVMTGAQASRRWPLRLLRRD